MKYRFRPTLQIVATLLAVVVGGLLGFFHEGPVDWLIVFGVALGVGLGMGFTRR